MITVCGDLTNISAKPNSLLQTIMRSMPGGVTTAGLTLEGFVHLLSMTVIRDRLDICWAMLERFGYNQALELSDDLFLGAPPRMSSVCPNDFVF